MSPKAITIAELFTLNTILFACSIEDSKPLQTLGTPSTIGISGHILMVVTGDLMGDLQPDVVAFTGNTAGTEVSSVTVYVRQPDQSLRSEHTLSLYGLKSTLRGARVLDMNGDNRNDLVIWTDLSIRVCLTSQSGSLDSCRLVNLLPDGAVISAVDIAQTSTASPPAIAFTYSHGAGNHLALATSVNGGEEFPATRLTDLPSITGDVTALQHVETKDGDTIKQVIYVVGQSHEELVAASLDGRLEQVTGFPPARIEMARFLLPGPHLLAVTNEDSSLRSRSRFARVFSFASHSVLTDVLHQELPLPYDASVTAITAITTKGTHIQPVLATIHGPRAGLLTLAPTTASTPDARFRLTDTDVLTLPFSIAINGTENVGFISGDGKAWAFPVETKSACSYSRSQGCSWNGSCDGSSYRIECGVPNDTHPNIADCICYRDDGAGMMEVGVPFMGTVHESWGFDVCTEPPQITLWRLAMQCGFPI